MKAHLDKLTNNGSTCSDTVSCSFSGDSGRGIPIGSIF